MANISDDIKYIPEDIAETEPLTTVIGIKCSDGIVLASDSQITSNSMKTYEGSKIFPINDFVVLGASGLVGQMKLLSESLKQELDKELLTDLDLRMKLENTLLSLHSKFNLHWSKSLGQKTTIFNPVSILGAKLKDGSFKLYLLNFTQNGPWIDEIENYEAIGHGYLLASLVLKQQSRVPKSDNKIFADLSFGYNMYVACYVINEVKNIDTYSGGYTKVMIINNEGIDNLPNEKAKDSYDQFIGFISKELSKALQSQNYEVKEEKIKRFFPEK